MVGIVQLEDDREDQIVLPDIYSKISDNVRRRIAVMRKEVNQNHVEYLKDCYSQPVCPFINYDYYSKAFTYFYFLENFWKAVITFSEAPKLQAFSIIDVGSGSGAISLAFLGFLENFLSERSIKISLELIDRSKVQLALAREFIDSSRGFFKRLQITAKYHCIDFQNWQSEKNSIDIMLFGHMLNENRDSVKLFLEKALRYVNDTGGIYIIERTDDNIWEVIGDDLARLKRRMNFADRKSDLLKTFTFRSNKIQNISQIATSYRILEHKQHDILLRLYFHAWETRSIALIEKIFSVEAEYQENPFKEPYRGIEAIKKYWKDNVCVQRDIHTRILRTVISGKDIIAEWEAEFKIFNQNVQLKGVLFVTIDLKKRQIIRLVEYFRKKDV